jgi:simple sugar transport system permease protein
MSSLDSVTRRLVGLAQGERSLVRLSALALAVLVLFSALSPNIFFSIINFQTIGFAVPEVGLLSLAVMVAMLTGGIDLSFVSTANLTALTTASLFAAFGATTATGGQAVLLTVLFMLAGLAVAALAGLFNGFLVAVVGVTPILATLGTLQLYNGIAIIWTGGEALFGMPQAFLALGLNTVALVPISFVVLVLISLALAVLLNRTPLGTKLRLVGANPTAARFSGINNRRVLLLTYVVSGLLAGGAGIIIASRSASASPDYGASYLLLAIVVAILGGTNPFGGYGTVFGVVLATVTLQMVSSGFNIMRLSAFEYTIAQGRDPPRRHGRRLGGGTATRPSCGATGRERADPAGSARSGAPHHRHLHARPVTPPPLPTSDPRRRV